uniref:Myb-like domain-containing protein n=1 Tax=Brassica oleracea var. oleracea TaxID=109376 RepID=A0A0D3BXV0_BRAOL
MATTNLLTAYSPGFCRLLRWKIDRNRRVRPESRSSRRLSRLLRQKTDPNPLSTTILSVLTASSPDWRVSQVSGERCGGEEVHEVKTSVDCVVNYGRDRSSASRVFENSLEIGRSQSFSSRLKLLPLSVKQLLLPTGVEDMDSTNPYPMSANFVDLLNSQQESVVPEPCPYASFQHVESSHLPEMASFCEDSTTERRERKKWTVTDDLVLISAWLNTSKDPVVGNEQKAGAFWSRIAAYFAASPTVERGAKREAIQCKQRWQKMNDLVCKFCGSYAAATRQKTSGQNEADTVKLAHEIFYNDHKIKFNLHHAWEELRNDQKWCEVASRKIDGTSKKRKFDDGAQSESSQATIVPPFGKGNIHVVHGNAADAVDEYLRLGETTTRSCVEHFVEEIINLFGEEYLRRPTPADLQRLLEVGEFRGFPGMIGSIDCMHWEWKNCPTAWKGQYSRGSGKPTIVLEAVASYDLWIWHAFFGPPGTLNDINILDRSLVFYDIIKGQAPQATFIQSIPIPQGPKATLFAQHQEAVRKDVERAFGVLQARFAIVKNPALFWDTAKIGRIMRACIILHNMIVEDERDGYTHFDVSEFQPGEDTGTSHVDLTYSTYIPSNIVNMMGVRTRIRDRQMHQQLKADLVEHLWSKFGRSGDNN